MLKSERFFLLVFVVWGMTVYPVAEHHTANREHDPQILSVFPLGAQIGNNSIVELEGRSLQGAHTVLFDCESLEARIVGVENFELETEAKTGESKDEKGSEVENLAQRVRLELKVGSEAKLGAHKFYLVTPQGVSNLSWLSVHAEPSVTEITVSEEHQFQRVQPPVIINGTILQDGEVDYYSFTVTAGSEMFFEVGSGTAVTTALGAISNARFDPTLTLYEPSGSWFNPNRLVRLAFNDEPNRMQTPMGKTAPRLKYRFSTGGRYLAAVGAFVNRVSGPHSHYQLYISLSQQVDTRRQKDFTQVEAHDDPSAWKERHFTRKLDKERLRILKSRTIGLSSGVVPTGQTPQSEVESQKNIPDGKSPERHSPINPSIDLIASVPEEEPNNVPGNASKLQLPVLIEGTIQEPGDVDYYSFQVESGARLAFEIQTPEEELGNFSPWLVVEDEKGVKVLSNLYVRLGGDGDDWVQTLEPKVISTFQKAGTYRLWISDITSRNGDGQCKYRLLVRHQIPHLGEVKIANNRLNLIRGHATKVQVSMTREEGFEGEIAVIIGNLPSGVEVFPAAEIEPGVGPSLAKIHPERFVPEEQNVTLVLWVKEDAESSQLPTF